MLVKKTKTNKIEDVILENSGLSREELLSPPKDLEIKNLLTAKDIILRAISEKKKVTVVADYDCDGICAAIIMKLALEKLNSDYTIRIPRRFSEGYGLNDSIVDEINDGLLITVDNGITAISAIQKAKDKGLDVVLTDHHLPLETGELPAADVIIDPNAISQAEFSGYCGAGLAFKLANELIKDEVFYKETLQFACIATIADIVPLVSENRRIVIDGLRLLNDHTEPKTTGLRALLSILDIDFNGIDEKTIGFKIGPIINAPGRLKDDGADIVLDALSYNDKSENAILTAKDTAKKLFSYNEERKALKTRYTEMLENIIAEQGLQNEKPLVLYHPNIHEGLVGILAGTFAEKYKTHCFVLTDAREGDLIKGSARGFGPGHIKNALDEISDILHRYGGHKSAAGLALKLADLDEFKKKIKSVLLCSTTSDDTFYDVEISEKEIEESLKILEKFAPYGEGNPAPVFLINDYRLFPKAGKFYSLLGKDGTFLKLNSKVNAITFNCKDKFIEAGAPNRLKIVGTLSYNRFNGRVFPQVEFVDFEKINKEKKTTELQQLLNKVAKK